ncbi:phosphoadenylyl-sulfate reductase [bacterium]|nr:phosphoadenylyl-sulfate reductase [bacterium]
MSMAETPEIVSELLKTVNPDDPAQLIAAVADRFPGRVTLASSLGAEDQVLTHMVRTVVPSIRIFVLDTGRLHQETYSVMSKTQDRYGFHYDVLFPQTDAVQKMVSAHGPNLFYESIELRKRCCYVRKVEPLGRALAEADAWITGLRREQAVTRHDLPVIEWDDANQKIKLNPLASWTTEQVWAYIQAHSIPYNILHDKGFPSIGCAPCTRAIKPGDDLRAGRWWWEDPDKKECGLHSKTLG